MQVRESQAQIRTLFLSLLKAWIHPNPEVGKPLGPLITSNVAVEKPCCSMGESSMSMDQDGGLPIDEIAGG